MGKGCEMGIFQRKTVEKRSMEEIMTPKSESEKEIAESDFLTEENSGRVEDFTDNALYCFGWKEGKTEKWLIKSARIWYGIMSFFWFLFGTLTFAPVIFISKKIRVVFKDKKLSLLVGGGIYALIVLTLVAIIIMRKL
jgi:hypothetical protein